MTWEAEAAEEALNHEPDHSCCDEGDREMIGTYCGHSLCGTPCSCYGRQPSHARPLGAS